MAPKHESGETKTDWQIRTISDTLDKVWEHITALEREIHEVKIELAKIGSKDVAASNIIRVIVNLGSAIIGGLAVAYFKHP